MINNQNVSAVSYKVTWQFNQFVCVSVRVCVFGLSSVKAEWNLHAGFDCRLKSRGVEGAVQTNYKVSISIQYKELLLLDTS